MEVLETVDRDRLAELRERDEFFWLDLTEPDRRRTSRRWARSLGLHPVAVEDTIEFGQRPKLDSYGEHVLFVFYTVRKGRNTGEGLFEPVEVHIYVSGSFVVTVRRAECTAARRAARRARHRRPEGGGVHRLHASSTS